MNISRQIGFEKGHKRTKGVVSTELIKTEDLKLSNEQLKLDIISSAAKLLLEFAISSRGIGRKFKTHNLMWLLEFTTY